jgi:hypothetical protein
MIVSLGVEVGIGVDSDVGIGVGIKVSVGEDVKTTVLVGNGSGAVLPPLQPLKTKAKVRAPAPNILWVLDDRKCSCDIYS